MFADRKSKWRLALMGCLALYVAGPLASDPNRLRPPDAIVQVEFNVRTYAQAEPWRDQKAESTYLPGIFLGNERVLARAPLSVEILTTTIHFGRDTVVSANIKHIDSELGLVLLELDRGPIRVDPLADVKPLELETDLAYLKRERLRVVQFRDQSGSDKIEYPVETLGVASQHVAGSTLELPCLSFTTWAPAASVGDILLDDEKLAGIIVEYDEELRQGCALTSDLMRDFLSSSDAARPFPALINIVDPTQMGTNTSSIANHPGFEYVPLVGDASRVYHGLAPGTPAAVVTRVYPWVRGSTRLREGDVILAVNDQDLDTRLALEDSQLGRISLGTFLITNGGHVRPTDTEFEFTVVRGRIKQKIKHRIQPFDNTFVRVPESFARPRYYIVGGLVFVELSKRYLANLSAPPVRLEYLADRSWLNQTGDGSRIVVLDRILSLPINEGYDASQQVATSVQGVAVRDLRHMRDLVDERIRRNENIAIGLGDGKLIVLDHSLIARSEELIRSYHGIQYLESNLD